MRDMTETRISFQNQYESSYDDDYRVSDSDSSDLDYDESEGDYNPLDDEIASVYLDT